MDIKHLIDYYAHVNVKFTDIFTNKMKPGQIDSGRTTAPGKCGLVVPLSGSASFSFNGAPYTMAPGMVIHAGPQMPIEIKVIGDQIWEYAVVHYSTSIEETNKYPLANQHFF